MWPSTDYQGVISSRQAVIRLTVEKHVYLEISGADCKKWAEIRENLDPEGEDFLDFYVINYYLEHLICLISEGSSSTGIITEGLASSGITVKMVEELQKQCADYCQFNWEELRWE